MNEGTRSIRTDRRGASELVGVLMLFFMVFAAAGLLVVAGDQAIDGARSAAALETETADLQQVNQQLNDVAFGAPEGSARIDAGSARVDGNATMSFRVNGNATRSSSVTVGTLRSRLDSGDVVTVENGGVWRRTESGTELVSAPPLEFDDGVLSFRVIDIGDAGGSSGELTVSRDLDASRQRTRQVYRDLFAYGNASAVDTLTVTVRSDHYDAWADYLESELGVAPTVDADRNTVSVTLTESRLDVDPRNAGTVPGIDDDSPDDGSDDDSPYDCTDESGGPAFPDGGENGCRPLTVDGDDVVVNQSNGTLELLGTQVGTTYERSATRASLDVNFVIDASGSNDVGQPDHEGRADEAPEWWGRYTQTDSDSGYLEPWSSSYRQFALVRDGGEWVPIQQADGVSVDRRWGANRYWLAPDRRVKIVGGWDVEGKRVEATRSFVDQLQPDEYDDRAGVVEFDTRGTVEHELSTDHEDVKRSITGRADGGTNIGAGMQSAVDQFDRNDRSGADEIMVVLTDGYNSPGVGDDDTREAIEAARERGITVYTVGFGASDADADNVRLLRRAAERTGGKYYNAGDADELESTFREIASDVTEERREIRANPVTVELGIGDETYYLKDNGRNQNLMDTSGPVGSNPNLNLNRELDRAAAFAVDDELSVGDSLSLSALTWDCADPEATGATRGDYEFASCEYPRSGGPTDHGGTVSVYTDGETVPEFDTQPWQRNVEDVVGAEHVRSEGGTRVFDLTDRQAVVVIETPVDGETSYVALLFEAGDEGPPEPPDDESGETPIPSGFDLRITQMELDDE